MMATVPHSSSCLLPLLDSLEDNTAGFPEQTDAYLTIANRLNGEEGRQFLPAVVKHFSRLGKTFQTHISSQNAELSQAALQALGFCVFHAHVVSSIPANFSDELLSSLCSLVMRSIDKNTCTRALWVISKQNFSTEVVAKKVPEILRTLECLQIREDIQSVVIEHESLNVIVRLLEQAPVQMGAAAVQWAKLITPLVVHSASKVRLRAAAALEMGLPLLLERQKEVAALVEPMMSSKLIPELQKMFSSKNETNVLKLWPLFVRLLGKVLHKGGPFINSLLGLEELGFRSSSPNIKKIAFIAWKSLIDNFALNPEILCSAKRLKLLMQPLSSIHVRTEALLLTKLEVWWYLVVKLGPNLPAHFEQVGVPLLQCTLGPDLSSPGTPARSSSQNSVAGNSTPKSGVPAISSSTATPRLNLNSSVVTGQAYPSIQLLGLEMLLHYFLGPEITSAAAKNKLTLSLEPLVHPFLSSPSSFNKHAVLLISAIRDSLICIGKDTPDSLLALIWKNLVSFVSTTIDAAGHKKERQGSEVLTLLLQALQSIISSEALPAHRALSLLEMTVKGIPQRVLGSASYQVGKMDVLNGTPALFLIILFYNSSQVSGFVEDERFFLCLETLVNCGLSGPTSPLAFGEAVLGAMGRAAGSLGNKEQLWRMWSVVVNPLIDTITHTNEVNQGDALEHNFSAVHTALMFPITHLFPGKVLPPMTQKSMLTSWSRLYKVFARCSALVATAEENVCCEELCGKMAVVLDKKALKIPSTLDLVANILLVIIESADFSPYTPQFQQKMKSPHTPLTWVRKKSKALGNLSSFQTLLVLSLEAFDAYEAPDTVPDGTGPALVSILSTLFSNLAVATAIQEALASLTLPLTALYKKAGSTTSDQPKFILCLGTKLEKLLSDLLGCLQTRSALAYDDELLSLLSPLLCVLFLHRIKHVRSLVTQFWNATFANSMVLAYPEELRPVLSQVKQNTPILLPGFQSVEVPDEFSGQYSSEGSQLDTALSGVQVTPGVKRDSLLARAGEMKDRSSKTSTKPVSTKLDFGSPKPPRREVLEEQASIDFVFIPPETKERVLTEHQKEVKRTKRVDIPAMYNNLDASLDTTAFTQYTQSQEESLENVPADDQAEDAANVEVTSEILEVENMEVGDDACDVLVTNTQEYHSPSALTSNTAANEKEEPVEVVPDSADVSMEDANEDVQLENQDVAMESREDCPSPNVSRASDLVSGTPQKPFVNNSRRQSFITLEKYTEGKPASPAVVKFTGPLFETSNSQVLEPSSHEPPVEKEADTDRLALQKTEQTRPNSSRNESSQKEGEEPSENKKESDVKKPAEKRPSETTEDEDDVIPDTQTQVEVLKADPAEVMGNNSQEEESEGHLEDSPSSHSQATLSQGEPRRSGRRRSRPLRPGEDTDVQDGKDKCKKKTQPGEATSHTGSPKTTSFPTSQNNSQSQGRASRRNKLPVEVEDSVKDKLRKSHKVVSDSRQSNSQVATHSPSGNSNSQSQGTRVSSRRSNKLGRDSEELVKDIRKRKGIAEGLSQIASKTDTPSPSDSDSQSQGRYPQKTKLAVNVEDDGSPKLRGRARKEKPSLPDSPVATPSQPESQSQGRASRRSKVFSDSEEFDHVGDVENQCTSGEQTQTISSIETQSPAAQKIDDQSLGKSIRGSESPHSDNKTKDKIQVGMEDQFSQMDSQTITPSAAPADGQSHSRSSRKSKVSVEVGHSIVQSPHVVTESAAALEMSQTDSQVIPTSTSLDDRQTRFQGRLRKRGKMLEKQVTASSPTPIKEGADQSGTPGSSHGSGRTTRLRASLGLLSSKVENSESDVSESPDDVQKPKKRDRKTKSHETLQIPHATVLSGVPRADQEIVTESSLMSDSQNRSSKALEVEIPMDIEDAQVLVPILPLITNAELGQRKADTQMVDMEGGMVEAADPVPEVATCDNSKTQIHSSVEPGLEQQKSQHGHMSPQKKESGHNHSKSISNLQTISSQETDLECDGLTLQKNNLLTDCEQAHFLSSTKENAVLDEDNIFLESNKLCTPPIAIGIPTGSQPSEVAVKLSQSLQVSESSEEKDVEAVPKSLAMSNADLTVDQDKEMVEDKENRPPEATNVLEQDQPEVVVDGLDNSFQQARPECSIAFKLEQPQEFVVDSVGQSLWNSQLECSNAIAEDKQTVVVDDVDKSLGHAQPVCSNVLLEDEQQSVMDDVDKSLGHAQPECSNVLVEDEQQLVVGDVDKSLGLAQPECSNVLVEDEQQQLVVDDVDKPLGQIQPECSSVLVEDEQQLVVDDVDKPLGQAQPECSSVLVEDEQQLVVDDVDKPLGQAQPECSSVLVEDEQQLVVDYVTMSNGQAQPECAKAVEEEQYTFIKEVLPEPKIVPTSVGPDNTQPPDYEVQDDAPLQERTKTTNDSDLECVEQEETQIESSNLDLCPVVSIVPLTDSHKEPVSALNPSTSKDMLCQDSPPKQKGLDGGIGLEVGQSPSSSRTRGVWSPSASPSSSILKKGQKRPIEEESPSPFTKCRRVSFADPIQHQELADDIDRRSPVIRSNSPRTKTTSSIPQPKFITTPTKALLILSPRNLSSPGYKSSKKCLISEMGQEPRPIPKDCVYPALVSCSTPVEAVLPQITSNMWPRGFGQLVRARNIKTVGDLSALTPSEIKNLPIRSPKISNVKKALQTYHEQQRKGRSDELKSFDEMEKMTSELEEPNLPQKPQQEEEEDKTPGEALATELSDEPVSMEQGPEGGPDQSDPDDQRPDGGLLSEVEALGNRLTGEELTLCSPDQLLQLHDQLAGMMRTVVVQLQSRLLCQNQDTGP